MNKKSTAIGAALLVLLGASSYGLLSPIFKLALESGAVTEDLTFAQIASGSAILWLAALVMRKTAFRGRDRAGSKEQKGGSAGWKDTLKLAAVGICGLSLTTVFYNQALAHLDASMAIVLLFQFTWITILLESIRYRKAPSKKERVAAAFVVLGTLLAVGLLENGVTRLDGLGVAYGLLSALTYSLFFFLTNMIRTKKDPIQGSAIMMTAGLVFVAALRSPAEFQWNDSLSVFGWGLLLGLLGSALPTICFNIGIPKLGGSLAAMLGAVELPVAVVVSAIVLGESFSWLQGIGVGLILAGIAASQGWGVRQNRRER
ncbi:DMT family transporter [Cohnella faecalis]|uniref:EamA family transporter n=1 Tax=Cohnella faecalis TaxID=2315694 RepID=A0A398CS68_9BACL|nr:DMT family transporter [Cohnella faecalis]RIE05050.1 EamA family transporter [Cohnella faecalis]